MRSYQRPEVNAVVKYGVTIFPTDVAIRIDHLARAERARHRTDDAVARAIAERVHQANRARLLAPEVEGRMEMEDVDRCGHSR